MKLFAALTALPALASAVSLTYDPIYDNKATPLTAVACSTGDFGLIIRGFKTFGSLPNFPHIGGAPAVTGFNSPACGTCWQLTYTNGQGVKKSISVLAIDVGHRSFNIAQSAMDELTGGQAVLLGRIDVEAVQVEALVCGL